MRISTDIANQMYLKYSTNDSEDSTCLATGTYSNLAAAKYIKDNDKDKDGVLTADEVTLSAEAYAKLDADSDGKVTKDEMQTALAGQDDAIFQFYRDGGAESTTDLASTLLAASSASSTSTGGVYSKLAASEYLSTNDADDNGVLTADEVSLSASTFAKVDADSDGNITATELKTALASKNSTILSYYKNGGTATTSELTSTLLATI